MNSVPWFRQNTKPLPENAMADFTTFKWSEIKAFLARNPDLVVKLEDLDQTIITLMERERYQEMNQMRNQSSSCGQEGIFLTGLPKDISKKDIVESLTMWGLGESTSMFIIKDSNGVPIPGKCIIYFVNTEDARKAISLQKVKVAGRKWRILQYEQSKLKADWTLFKAD